MSPLAFYTRSPELADIRRVVREHLDPAQPFKDFNLLVRAVDTYCSEHFQPVDRGGWFTPRVLGGSQLSHTPPHVIFWAYAIYVHLASGDPDPLPFLSGPLALDGATAIFLEPTEGLLVADRLNHAHAMTDFLAVIPALTPRTWVVDTYGLPELQPGITIVGWHAAAQPFLEAVSSGQVLLHPASNRVLDPLGTFTEEEEQMFFVEPVNSSRLERYRERLVEVFGTCLEALQQNSGSACRVVEAYLPRPPA